MLLTLAMFIGAYFEPVLIWAALVLTVIDLSCYLTAPVAYILDQEQLVVIRRVNSKTFAPVIRCVSIEHDKPAFTLRLWGNGGLFAGTGIFWNKRYGLFKAYVTTGKRSHLVLVETPADRVIISPENPDIFLSN